MQSGHWDSSGYKIRNWLLGSAQVLGMAGLCAVGAELLAAYAENTGDLPAVLFTLVFFMGLYGAPALLVREIARRASWGWPSLILLILALSIAEACIIDQALFSEDYQGYEGWSEARQNTIIPVFSISAYNAYNFIIGHVIFSFGAPIAIAEAWWPRRASKQWLGPVGLTIATLAYIGTATLIILDPASQSASLPQLVTSILLVIACIAAAWLVGRKFVPRATGDFNNHAPRIATVFGVTFVLVVIGIFAEDDWAGFALGMVTTVLIAVFVWWGAKRPGWGLRHAAAVGLAYLVCRGVFAFTYFPLAGEVEAVPKYAHNIIMMMVVLGAGMLALRPSVHARQVRPSTR